MTCTPCDHAYAHAGRSTDFVKRLGALPPKEREAVEEKLADMFAGVFTREEIQDITATF